MKGTDLDTLFLQMEDYDNAELEPWERDEQLIEQIHAFNEENGTKFSDRVLSQYKAWQREKFTKEPTE